MRSTLALLILLSAGCAEDPLRVALFTPEQGPLVTASAFEPALEEAVAILGHDVELTRDHRGAVTVEILDVDHDGFALHGRSLLNSSESQIPRCYRALWVVNATPRLLAHELGHALGLEHTDRAGNLMVREGGADDIELTDDQQDAIDREVRRLGRC
jgi:hypothetical protein